MEVGCLSIEAFLPPEAHRDSTVVNQLAMNRVQAVKYLEQLGYFELSIADQLGISRTAVRNHLGRNRTKDTKAPTGPGASSEVAINPVSNS
jgi:hypothetical protein